MTLRALGVICISRAVELDDVSRSRDSLDCLRSLICCDPDGLGSAAGREFESLFSTSAFLQALLKGTSGAWDVVAERIHPVNDAV